MISASDATIWIIIVVMGIGTFLIRYSFLGLLGQRELSPWLLRHLRYTAVSVLPALVAPLVLWPGEVGGAVDPLRIATCVLTLAVGYLTKNGLWAILAGFVCFFGLGAVL